MNRGILNIHACYICIRNESTIFMATISVNRTLPKDIRVGCRWLPAQVNIKYGDNKDEKNTYRQTKYDLIAGDGGDRFS
jgi:hypothetical protein